MSTSSFEADPEALRATQPQFAQLASRVTDAVAALTQVIEKEGVCWGTDQPGAAFAKNYVDAAKQTQDTLGSVPGVLSGLGDSMKTIADAIDQQDQSTAAALMRKKSEI
jgi:uncharacterized protein YukE